MGVKETLSKELGKSKEYVALATVDAAKYQQTNIDVIAYLTKEQKTPGVYVTLNKPFDKVSALLKSKGVDLSVILFIDAVTKTAGGKSEREHNCLFIGNPENLSDLSVAMDQAVRAIPGTQKFVFFDSLSTLLIYNKPAVVAKFIHFLSTKMHLWKVKGIIITLQKEGDKELINELMQFCDIKLEL